VDKVGNELFWCHGGSRLPEDVFVVGVTDEPFFLLSLLSPIPNLYAIPFGTPEAQGHELSVACLHSNATIELCESGRNKAKDAKSVEDVFNQHV
jgi:hypothetical protein